MSTQNQLKIQDGKRNKEYTKLAATIQQLTVQCMDKLGGITTTLSE
jgi:hypothetical protein